MMEGRKKTIYESYRRRCRSTSLLQNISVLFSVFGVILLATYCSAQRIAAPRTDPIRVPTPSVGKTPARRVMDPAFANAGKNAGLEIWRIENFHPVAYPQRDFGKFYTGDSYIVLNTKVDKNNRYNWDVHFWLGSETSQDEAGAAAILTVQLDDVLNGDPIQHREVQDHESNLFLGYFKNGKIDNTSLFMVKIEVVSLGIFIVGLLVWYYWSEGEKRLTEKTEDENEIDEDSGKGKAKDGIRYESGGVGTGFKHVQTNAGGEKRLFQVKGKRNVRVRQVNLSISSMNKGDCFILDAGNDIYVYVGSGAKRVEKLKAISAANQIRDQDHNGRAKVQIIDEFSTDADKQQFFTVLGSGSPDQVPEESTADEDQTFETNEERITTLYKITDKTGTLKVDTISTKPLRQDMLDTNDCFILDTGSGIFVWVGKGATQQEKSQAMTKAQEFLNSKKYPAWTQVHRIVEGAESAPFKQYFSTWRDHGMAHTRLVRAANEEIDESTIQSLKKSGGRALGFMPDKATGKIAGAWLHKDEVQEELPSDKYGVLFGNGAYVITYEFDSETGEKGLVSYFWLGKKSSEADQIAAEKTAALKAVENENPISIIVRVPQGHEPRHLRKIFKGKLFTAFEKDNGAISIYRIRGTAADDVITEELTFNPSSLASDDVFLVGSAEKYFVWNGIGASDFEKTQGESVVKSMSENVETISEGSEPEEFWNLLGGKADYDKTIGDPGSPILEPRLFHCKILANGRFKFDEIEHFKQEDLDIDDVMIFDGGDEVYVWIGSGATKTERAKSYPMAMEYIRQDPTARTEDTVPMIKLEEGHEPDCFKRLFPSWDDDCWKSLPSYEDVKNAILEVNEALNDL